MALPGVSVTINDGQLRGERSIQGTRVLLLGTTTSTDLNLYEPVLIDNITIGLAATRLAATNTGSNQRGESELSLGIVEAFAGGAQAVEVCKIATVDGLSYTGYSTNDRYLALQNAYSALSAHSTDIVVPLNAHAEEVIGTGYNTTVHYWTGGTNTADSFARQLAQFCYEQTKNHNTTIGVIGVKPPLLSPVVNSPFDGSGYNMSIGDTGFLFGSVSVTGLYEWVNSYLTHPSTTGTNLAWKAYLSGSTTNFANSYLTSTYWQARNSDGSGAVDELGNKVDLGAYVNVVAAPMRSTVAPATKLALEYLASPSNIYVNTNGAAAYAGMVSSLNPEEGTTFKPLPGIVENIRLSESQATTLVNSRLVTMLTRSRGYVVAKGVTGAHYVTAYNKSDFTQLTTLRITLAAIDLIRSVGEKYIGSPMNGPSINAFNKDIDSALRAMQLAGALTRYDFTVNTSPTQRALGQSSVSLVLVPAFELTDVALTVKLAKE